MAVVKAVRSAGVGADVTEESTRIDNTDYEMVARAIKENDPSILKTDSQKTLFTQVITGQVQLVQEQADDAEAAQSSGAAYPFSQSAGLPATPTNQPVSVGQFVQDSGVLWRATQTQAVEPTVVRTDNYEKPTDPGVVNYGPGGVPIYKPYYRPAPLSEYEGEYAQKALDEDFRTWMEKRAVVVGKVNPEDPNWVTAIPAVWSNAGKLVGSNPYLAARMTPEQWLDEQYELNGGDAAYNAIMEKAKAAQNPIKTTTTTQTYQVTAEQAQATLDNLSQALLGRMASDAELKKARAIMQSMLTPTTTTMVTDSTDPSNVTQTQSTEAGVGPDEAAAQMQMDMQRSSEGMAFGAGKMFIEALRGIG
jgi:hypothetical protein